MESSHKDGLNLDVMTGTTDEFWTQALLNKTQIQSLDLIQTEEFTAHRKAVRKQANKPDREEANTRSTGYHKRIAGTLDPESKDKLAQRQRKTEMHS